VAAFLAASNGPTATSADPSISVPATNLDTDGNFLVAFDGALLDAALLDSNFANAPTMLIIEQAANMRVCALVTAQPARTAVLK
jgi:hypothetical protein